MTTPKLKQLVIFAVNYVIISGALLMYVSVFFGLLPSTDQDIVRMQCIVSSHAKHFSMVHCKCVYSGTCVGIWYWISSGVWNNTG